jgi:hypothetical protein
VPVKKNPYKQGVKINRRINPDSPLLLYSNNKSLVENKPLIPKRNYMSPNRDWEKRL